MPQAIITVSVMAALLPRISRAAARRRPRRGPRRHLAGPAHLRGRDRPGRLRLPRPRRADVHPALRIQRRRGRPLHGLHPDGVRPRPDPVLRAVRRAARLLRVRGHPDALLQHGHRRRRQRGRLGARATFCCPPSWAVVGMAASYGLAYAVGVGVAWQRLRKRLRRRPGRRTRHPYVRPPLHGLRSRAPSPAARSAS